MTVGCTGEAWTAERSSGLPSRDPVGTDHGHLGPSGWPRGLSWSSGGRALGPTSHAGGWGPAATSTKQLRGRLRRGRLGTWGTWQCSSPPSTPPSLPCPRTVEVMSCVLLLTQREATHFSGHFSTTATWVRALLTITSFHILAN